MASDQLNVVALISGGKDSFYSVLHCLRHGHRVVALANLFPGSPSPRSTVSEEGSTLPPGGALELVALAQSREGGHGDDNIVVFEPEDAVPIPTAPQSVCGQEGPPPDLNSFMYQTVGHQVIPLYAAATGLPVYRKAIVGGAANSAADYEPAGGEAADETYEADETESMLALLRAVKRRHPEVNAVCAGAILSKYQRTRVESVAVRLGLTPLAFLWKYPVLPAPTGSGEDDPAQLLRDMEAAGLDARIVKVASAGLDERFLWERVTCDAGAGRVSRALKRFQIQSHAGSGSSRDSAAVLGEGGEFETLVVDGPPVLFKRRIEVVSGERSVVVEGGGSAWLNIGGGAMVVGKPAVEDEGGMHDVRIPALLDDEFQSILDQLDSGGTKDARAPSTADLASLTGFVSSPEAHWQVPDAEQRSIILDPKHRRNGVTAAEETALLAAQIRHHLASAGLTASSVLFTTIVLRRMADFSAVNAEYGRLFPRPNPPSRVTISCGDLLPPGCQVAIYLTLSRGGTSPAARRGLHVQSRSYWAPANIGPYSQAIQTPLFAESLSDSSTTTAYPSPDPSVASVLVAGQIPLVPSTMALPPGGANAPTTPLQTVMSLQHLCRIGIDMQVQIWTSAVAYLGRAVSREAARDAAHLAALAWARLHVPDGDDDDGEWDGGDIDPWDSQYNNSRPWEVSVMVGGLGPGQQQRQRRKLLPDWSVFRDTRVDKLVLVPPFFAAEVEELPRGSGVEWHAHMGLANVPSGSVQMGCCFSTMMDSDSAAQWESKHMLIDAPGAAVFVLSVVFVETLGSGAAAAAAGIDAVVKTCAESNARALSRLSGGSLVGHDACRPSVLYVVDPARNDEGRGWEPPRDVVVIPCHSLWGGVGIGAGDWNERVKPLAAVAVFRSWYKKRTGV